MRFLDRLLGRSQPRTANALMLHAGSLVEVVGESYRQDTLRRVAARTSDSSRFLPDLHGHARKIAEAEPHTRWFQAALVPEPENPNDRNAVAVYADGVGRVGYLSRDDAVGYRPVFAALQRKDAVGACPAFLIGGTPGKPSYGVMLCLSSPNRVLRDLEVSG